MGKRKSLTEEQSALVEQHTHVAATIARRWASRVRIDFDELYSVALLGLCDAALRYKPGPGSAPFGAYVRPRISGRIVDDALRKGSLVSGARNHFDEISVVSDDPLMVTECPDSRVRPEQLVERRELQARMRRLPRREMMILVLRSRGWKFAQIGKGFGMTGIAAANQLRVVFGQAEQHGRGYGIRRPRKDRHAERKAWVSSLFERKP